MTDYKQDAVDRQTVEMELQSITSRRELASPENLEQGKLAPPIQSPPEIESQQQTRRRQSSMQRSQRADLHSLKAAQRNLTEDHEPVFEEDESKPQGGEARDQASLRRDSRSVRSASIQTFKNSHHGDSPRPSIYAPGNSGPPTALPSAAASVDALAAPQLEHAFPVFQTRPPEIKNALAEVLFILVCSTGQLLFGVLSGGLVGLQIVLTNLLQIQVSQTPWISGAFLLANGLSVIVSGPLADLIPPKYLMCGAFAGQAVANIIGIFSLHDKYLFFVVRALQGLSVGVLTSSSISILGRVYKPGRRKTRVFAIMAAMAPLGFWLGTLQGGGLARDPKWIFVCDAIVSGFCLGSGLYAIPHVRPAQEGLSFKCFDYVGSLLAVAGCALLVAGLTQGPAANWAWYMIFIVLLGVALLVAFFFAERRVARPLIPPMLWKVPSFTPMIIAYFLGFGSFLAWQFYSISFWLRVQHASPLLVGLYQTPNAIFGILATVIVARIAHIVDGHWILATSMVAFALGPVFFIPQKATTTYWALSMPGVSLATFGPDLSFAAVSIFVTSNVAKHYQGSAGSLLMTVQNLSAAIMTSLADTIGQRVGSGSEDDLSLKTLHIMWWFDFAAAMVAAVIVLVAVRIPRATEKEHVQ